MQTTKYFNDLNIICVTGRIYHWYNHQPFGSPGYSIEFIRRGKVKLHIDERSLLLEAPVLFWLGPGHTYRYEICRRISPKPYEHLWVDFSRERGRRIYTALCSSFADHHIQPCDPEAVGIIFEQLLEDFRLDRQGNHASLVLGVEKLVWHIYHSSQEQTVVRQDPYRIMAAAELVRINPLGIYNGAEFARERQISENYFRRLFKEKIGMPFHDYILSSRMDMAAGLLEAGKMRITEIADYCGFEELSSFSRTFKHYFGCSPRNYRQHINR